MSKKHMGSSIDDFMKQEGVFEQVWVTSHSEFFKRWADRFVVTRQQGGWTTATPAAPNARDVSLPFAYPLVVTNSGTADFCKLPPSVQQRLGLDTMDDHGTTLFVRDEHSRLDLLAFDEATGINSTDRSTD